MCCERAGGDSGLRRQLTSFQSAAWGRDSVSCCYPPSPHGLIINSTCLVSSGGNHMHHLLGLPLTLPKQGRPTDLRWTGDLPWEVRLEFEGGNGLRVGQPRKGKVLDTLW